MPKKLTQAEFLARAVAAHGVGRYDYSQTVYEDGLKKVKIKCPEHGVFEQRPEAHSRGIGCIKCGFTRTRKAATLSTEAFIEKARLIHGFNKYDYSQSIYTNSKKLIKIVCSVHGLFEQIPNNHLTGYGCNKCGFIQGCGKTAFNNNKFITKAEALHGIGTYDYSQVVYTRSTKKVKIICPRHGLFEQTASLHTRGGGCPKCGRKRQVYASRREWVVQAKGKECSLYFIKLFNHCETFYKIGVTFHSVAFRYRSDRYLGGYNYEMLAIHKSCNAAAVYDWEQSIIESFKHLQYSPINRFEGATECFSSCEEILSIFPL